MVWDPDAGENGMWVPVNAANPMEVRVRQLEAQIAALQQFLEGRLNADLADVLARLNTDLSTRASEQTLVQARDALSALAGTVDAGAQKVTLSGRIRQVVLPRAVRNTSISPMMFPAPPQARGAVVTLRNFGTTGQFEQGQGIALLTRPLTDVSSFSTGALEMTSARETSNFIRKQHVYLPGADIGDMTPISGQHEMQVAGLPPLEGIGFQVLISGTFDEGQGFDCQVDILWLI